MSEPLRKFQNLLCELFEFDCADLDFGIYRIMNHKRQVIERFIAEDLPKAIAEELQRGALAQQTQAQEALQAARQKVLEVLGEEALDADGNLAEIYRNTPAGKAYLEAQAQAAGSRSYEALEAAIYNHLYTFFSRYWQDGDFISKRRYSKKERYAIPYNGEEVYLYWANHDQYYVKTGEYFTDYSYKAPNGVSVHFKLQQANVEQNNVKGEKRFFLPLLDGITYSPLPTGEGSGVRGTLTITFQFRPLTEQETIAYGQKNQQEAIIAKAVEEIPKRVKAAEALAALTPERRKTEKGGSVSWLEHHLRQYTARNTRDFFIHKDLRSFLSRELDFYLKNEVLNLEELEAAGEQLAEGWFQLLRLIKRIGNQLIDFLAQIEDFQKMLWEKKKFITETFYVITLGKIPEAFYPEIAANDAQWEEWRAMEFVKEKPDDPLSFFINHPTLPLDTRHFSADFTDRLLASLDNLDEMTDGLLVHSENWQALNLLQEKYRERVKCIYIDPPFNTGADFLYKDMFRNSTWLALLTSRIDASLPLLAADGNYFLHLDYNAVHYGKMILLGIFPEVNELVYNTNATKDEESGLFSYKSFAPKFVRQHDTILHAFKTAGHFVKLWKPNRNKSQLGLGQLDILSVPKKQNPKSLEDFRYFIECYHNGRLHQKELNVNEKIFPIGDVWNDIYSFTQSEMRTSENVSFPTQKPENLLRRVIQSSTLPGDIVLDFFGGSGTTSVVAHKLARHYILVEIGEYFEETYDDYDAEKSLWVKKLGVLGRMKKVLHGDESFEACGRRRRSNLSKQIGWQGGGIVKVIRVESYEDALNNLTFDDASGQKALELFKDEYLLHYMLKWETRHSKPLLDVEQLQTPFSYKLRLHRNGETREQSVDLPETFNYLIGLDVQTRRVLPSPNGRGAGGEGRYLVYRGTLRNGRTVAVIWRETKGWGKEEYERDRDFVMEQKLIEGADEVFVNGDSLIPGAQSLDPLFKERMFSALEA